MIHESRELIIKNSESSLINSNNSEKTNRKKVDEARPLIPKVKISTETTISEGDSPSKPSNAATPPKSAAQSSFATKFQNFFHKSPNSSNIEAKSPKGSTSARSSKQQLTKTKQNKEKKQILDSKQHVQYSNTLSSPKNIPNGSSVYSDSPGSSNPGSTNPNFNFLKNGYLLCLNNNRSFVESQISPRNSSGFVSPIGGGQSPRGSIKKSFFLVSDPNVKIQTNQSQSLISTPAKTDKKTTRNDCDENFGCLDNQNSSFHLNSPWSLTYVALSSDKLIIIFNNSKILNAKPENSVFHSPNGKKSNNFSLFPFGKHQKTLTIASQSPFQENINSDSSLFQSLLTDYQSHVVTVDISKIVSVDVVSKPFLFQKQEFCFCIKSFSGSTIGSKTPRKSQQTNQPQITQDPTKKKNPGLNIELNTSFHDAISPTTDNKGSTTNLNGVSQLFLAASSKKELESWMGAISRARKEFAQESLNQAFSILLNSVAGDENAFAMEILNQMKRNVPKWSQSPKEDGGKFSSTFETDMKRFLVYLRKKPGKQEEIEAETTKENKKNEKENVHKGSDKEEGESDQEGWISDSEHVLNKKTSSSLRRSRSKTSGITNESLASPSSGNSGSLEAKNSSEESLKSWEIPYSQLKFSRKIAEGFFGEVFEGELFHKKIAIKRLKIDNSATIAVKENSIGDSSGTKSDTQHQTSLEIAKTKEREKIILKLKNEAALMASCRHPNLLLFMGLSTEDKQNFCLITEFIEGGTLYDCLKNHTVTDCQFVHMMKDITCGMLYLHEKVQILHLDLKPQNILIDDSNARNMDLISENERSLFSGNSVPNMPLTTFPKNTPRVVISDFGISQILHKGQRVIKQASKYGTIMYMSNEMIMGPEFGKKSDVFSFGIMLFEMFYQRDGHPNTNFSADDSVGYQYLREPLYYNKPVLLPIWWPKRIKELISKAVSNSPDKRPDFRDIIQDFTTFLQESEGKNTSDWFILEHNANRIRKLVANNRISVFQSQKDEKNEISNITPNQQGQSDEKISETDKEQSKTLDYCDYTDFDDCWKTLKGYFNLNSKSMDATLLTVCALIEIIHSKSFGCSPATSVAPVPSPFASQTSTPTNSANNLVSIIPTPHESDKISSTSPQNINQTSSDKENNGLENNNIISPSIFGSSPPIPFVNSNGTPKLPNSSQEATPNPSGSGLNSGQVPTINPEADIAKKASSELRIIIRELNHIVSSTEKMFCFTNPRGIIENFNNNTEEKEVRNEINYGITTPLLRLQNTIARIGKFKYFKKLIETKYLSLEWKLIVFNILLKIVQSSEVCAMRFLKQKAVSFFNDVIASFFILANNYDIQTGNFPFSEFSLLGNAYNLSSANSTGFERIVPTRSSSGKRERSASVTGARSGTTNIVVFIFQHIQEISSVLSKIMEKIVSVLVRKGATEDINLFVEDGGIEALANLANFQFFLDNVLTSPFPSLASPKFLPQKPTNLNINQSEQNSNSNSNSVPVITSTPKMSPGENELNSQLESLPSSNSSKSHRKERSVPDIQQIPPKLLKNSSTTEMNDKTRDRMLTTINVDAGSGSTATSSPQITAFNPNRANILDFLKKSSNLKKWNDIICASLNMLAELSCEVPKLASLIEKKGISPFRIASRSYLALQHNNNKFSPVNFMTMEPKTEIPANSEEKDNQNQEQNEEQVNTDNEKVTQKYLKSLQNNREQDTKKTIIAKKEGEKEILQIHGMMRVKYPTIKNYFENGKKRREETKDDGTETQNRIEKKNEEVESEEENSDEDSESQKFNNRFSSINDIGLKFNEDEDEFYQKNNDIIAKNFPSSHNQNQRPKQEDDEASDNVFSIPSTHTSSNKTEFQVPNDKKTDELQSPSRNQESSLETVAKKDFGSNSNSLLATPIASSSPKLDPIAPEDLRTIPTNDKLENLIIPAIKHEKPENELEFTPTISLNASMNDAHNRRISGVPRFKGKHLGDVMLLKAQYKMIRDNYTSHGAYKPSTLCSPNPDKTPYKSKQNEFWNFNENELSVKDQKQTSKLSSNEASPDSLVSSGTSKGSDINSENGSLPDSGNVEKGNSPPENKKSKRKLKSSGMGMENAGILQYDSKFLVAKLWEKIQLWNNAVIRDNLDANNPVNALTNSQSSFSSGEDEQTLRNRQENEASTKSSLKSDDLQFIKENIEEEIDEEFAKQRIELTKQLSAIMHVFEKPSRITKHIYIGSEWNSSNREEMQVLGITHILNCSGESPNYFPDDFRYWRIPIHVSDTDLDISIFFKDVFEFINEAIGPENAEKSGKVLVHSHFGTCRAAAFVIQFLMKKCKKRFANARLIVERARVITQLNSVFMKQLQKFEKELFREEDKQSRFESKQQKKQENAEINEQEIMPSSIPQDVSKEDQDGDEENDIPDEIEFSNEETEEEKRGKHILSESMIVDADFNDIHTRHQLEEDEEEEEEADNVETWN